MSDKVSFKHRCIASCKGISVCRCSVDDNGQIYFSSNQDNMQKKKTASFSAMRKFPLPVSISISQKRDLLRDSRRAVMRQQESENTSSNITVTDENIYYSLRSRILGF
ncbi:hypothetical protein EAI_08643 [Harpegnathos saltator]|uniref:Uncharacterized protein n=1 Tax=Harpegnathos saltator TaxID=610380 RepID=E2C352_HARSA|nr:hypothetical protein EAI_08643 [Harpegnathos saltator]